jgi:hypothetical protein
VDQTNDGIGFGTIVGSTVYPTYPLAVYRQSKSKA